MLKSLWAVCAASAVAISLAVSVVNPAVADVRSVNTATQERSGVVAFHGVNGKAHTASWRIPSARPDGSEDLVMSITAATSIAGVREFIESQDLSPITDVMKENVRAFSGSAGTLLARTPDQMVPYYIDGNLTVSGNTITLRVPRDQVGTQDNWWAAWAAAALGGLIALVSYGACYAALITSAPPFAAPICNIVFGFVGGFASTLLAQAFNGDPLGVSIRPWVNALAFGLVGALGARYFPYVAPWIESTGLPLFQSLARAANDAAGASARWFFGNALGTISAAMVYVYSVGRSLFATMAREAVRRGWTWTTVDVRLMPLGDSITSGFRSSNGSGYRGPLFADLEPRPGNLDLVGDLSDGSVADPQHEGHSGWTIDQIAGVTASSLQRSRPNVVALLAGTNDLGSQIDVPNAPRRLLALVDRILATDPEIQVLVGIIPVSSNGGLQARITAFNDAVIDGLATRSRVEPVDTSLLTLSDMADPLHPNDSGYRKLSDAFSSSLYGLLYAGSVKAPRPAGTGSLANCIDQRFLQPQGEIAGGVGASGRDIRLADLNGDGRDDYLAVKSNGAVDAWVNNGGSPGNWNWDGYGRVANGVGTPGREIEFADINGDGRDDYLSVSDEGRVFAWINGSGQKNNWTWLPQGEIAAGVGRVTRDDPLTPNDGVLDRIADYSLDFGDLNGDGKDDYLVSARDSGATEAWINSGANAFKPNWNPIGTIATGTGPEGTAPIFGNVDCNRRDEYLRVDLPGGRTEASRNNGPSPTGGWSWSPIGEIAGGTGTGTTDTITYADLDGDGRDDYVIIRNAGQMTVYLTR